MNWYDLENIKKLQKAWEMILPTIYNESLSYIQKLEHILDIIKKLIESNIELTDEWIKLKDFIDTQLKEYTEEQLQEWLDDGTLENMILHLGKIVKYHDTTDSLIKDTSIINGQIVITKGRHTIGDKGNAIFYISNVKNSYSYTLENNLYANLLSFDNYIAIDNVFDYMQYYNDIDLKGCNVNVSNIPSNVKTIINGTINVVSQIDISNLTYLHNVKFNININDTNTWGLLFNNDTYTLNIDFDIELSSQNHSKGILIESDIYLSKLKILANNMDSVLKLNSQSITGTYIYLSAYDIVNQTLINNVNSNSFQNNIIIFKETANHEKTCFNILGFRNTHNITIYNDSDSGTPITPFTYEKNVNGYNSIENSLIECSINLDKKTFYELSIINSSFLERTGRRVGNLQFSNNFFNDIININDYKLFNAVYNLGMIYSTQGGSQNAIDVYFTINQPVIIYYHATNNTNVDSRPETLLYDGKRDTSTGTGGTELINLSNSYSDSCGFIIKNKSVFNKELTFTIRIFDFISGLYIVPYRENYSKLCRIVGEY